MSTITVSKQPRTQRQFYKYHHDVHLILVGLLILVVGDIVQYCHGGTATQLNATENYGRRCLTPLSPHRNYILS